MKQKNNVKQVDMGKQKLEAWIKENQNDLTYGFCEKNRLDFEVYCYQEILIREKYVDEHEEAFEKYCQEAYEEDVN